MLSEPIKGIIKQEMKQYEESGYLHLRISGGISRG